GVRRSIHPSIVASASAMVSALTGTPRTSNRAGAPPMQRSDGLGIDRPTGSPHERLAYLLLDPRVRPCETFFEGNARFPVQNSAQARVVRIAAAHTLWSVDVLLGDVDACTLRDDVGQSVHRDHAVLPEVDRCGMVRFHEPHQSFDAIVDV